MRYLVGRPVALRHVFVDGDDVLSPPAVTVTVTRAGSTDPTIDGPAAPDGDGWTLAAGLLPMGLYAVRWDGGSTAVDMTSVEVVGGRLFGVPELRAADPELTVERHPADVVEAVRTTVEAEFERITGRSFVRRLLYIPVVELPECGHLLPVRDVAEVTALGVEPEAVTVERFGAYAYVPELPPETTGVEILYGLPAVPAGIKRAGLLFARWLLLEDRSGIPDRATSYQPAEGGTYSLATPGRAGAETGLPVVDAVLAGYQHRIVESVMVT